jgi:preprotein translocase subunit YajC
MTSFHSYALAILQSAPSGGIGSMMPFIFQMAAIFGIFYFIVIRPQQKQRKLQEAMLMALKKGDDVVTAGGLIAQVIHLQQKVVDGATVASLDDQITIRSGESKLVVERGKIAKVVPKAESAAVT